MKNSQKNNNGNFDENENMPKFSLKFKFFKKRGKMTIKETKIRIY